MTSEIKVEITLSFNFSMPERESEDDEDKAAKAQERVDAIGDWMLKALREAGGRPHYLNGDSFATEYWDWLDMTREFYVDITLNFSMPQREGEDDEDKAFEAIEDWMLKALREVGGRPRYLDGDSFWVEDFDWSGTEARIALSCNFSMPEPESEDDSDKAQERAETIGDWILKALREAGGRPRYLKGDFIAVEFESGERE